MSIAFRCPRCGSSLTVSDVAAGTKTLCPSCGQKLLVPAPPAPPQNKTVLGEWQTEAVPPPLPTSASPPAPPSRPAPPRAAKPGAAADGLAARLPEVGAGGLLIVALLVVLITDRLTSRSTATVVGPNTLVVNVVAGDAKPAQPERRLRLAVATGKVRDPSTNEFVVWDDMSKLLDQLGEGFRYEAIAPESLLETGELNTRSDVLFLTCGIGGEDLKDRLRNYVEQGGTLYASDWRYNAVAAAFPEYADASTRGDGTGQELVATVTDPSLAAVVGTTVPLRFDLSLWKTAAFSRERVQVLLEGNYRRMRSAQDNVGVPAFAPLLVRFRHGKGTVIFTSFHNEKQNSDVERKLLEYLVFSLVTAKVEAAVQTSISAGGFAPQTSNILSTPNGQPTVAKTYESKKAGALRFALGFRAEEGAHLRLRLQAPTAAEYTWEGRSTVILEVPDAPVGTWTYTVTALSLPYPNFPFTVTVGEKK